MSDITDLLSSLAISRISNWNIIDYLLGNVWDAFTILTAVTLLLVTIIGFSLYLLFMSRDAANEDRLLNVLYGNLCVCHQMMSVLMFSHYLELRTLGAAPTLLSCVSDRCRLFLGLFILLLFLQISVVTSISHYNPGLYLHLSLHWRRIPALLLQFLITGLTLGLIELSTGFEEVCISVKTKETFNLTLFLLLAINLILQLGVVVDSYWGWSNLKKYVTIRPSSIHPDNVVELGIPGEARSGDQPNSPQLASSISTDKVNHVFLFFESY